MIHSVIPFWKFWQDFRINHAYKLILCQSTYRICRSYVRVCVKDSMKEIGNLSEIFTRLKSPLTLSSVGWPFKDDTARCKRARQFERCLSCERSAFAAHDLKKSTPCSSSTPAWSSDNLRIKKSMCTISENHTAKPERQQLKKLFLIASMHATARDKKCQFSWFCSYSKTKLMYLSSSSIIVKRKKRPICLKVHTIRSFDDQRTKKTRRLHRTEGWYPRVHCHPRASRLVPRASSSAQGLSNCSKIMAFPRVVGQFCLKSSPSKVCLLASSRSRFVLHPSLFFSVGRTNVPLYFVIQLVGTVYSWAGPPVP